MKSDSYSYDFLPDILEGEKQKASTHKSENNDLINNKELFSLDSKKQRLNSMVNIPVAKIKEIKNIHNKLKEFHKTKPFVIKHSLEHKILKYLMLVGTTFFIPMLVAGLTTSISSWKYFDYFFLGPFMGTFLLLILYFTLSGCLNENLASKFKSYFKNDIFKFDISELIFVNNNDFSNPNKNLDFLLDDTYYDKKMDLDALFKIYKEHYLNSE